MSKLVNPYQAGNPVRHDRGFFGRIPILNWVEEALDGPNVDSLVIFGQRRIGKTSLLYKLQRTLTKKRFRSIYFDLQAQIANPLGAVLSELADAIADEVEMPYPPSERFDDQGRYFERGFLPEVFEKLDGDRRLVILFDEFEILDQTDPRELVAGSPSLALYRFLSKFIGTELRLVFIFSMGERVDNLSHSAKALLKSCSYKAIGSLTSKSAEDLVRQAEANGTLRFTDHVVERILALTQCHPYLTQLLCQTIWKQAFRQRQDSGAPVIDVAEVEAAIEETLETGDHSLAWIWDALNPVEEIYLAALGEIATEGEPVAVDRVIETIDSQFPERRTREVEQASHGLVNREILREKGADGHIFSIELFRRWTHLRKTLRSVDDHLSRVKPDADVIFAVAEKVYREKRYERASHLFWQALDINNYHLRARLLLGECLLQLGETEKAIGELGRAYEQNPRQAYLALARALEKRAEELRDEDEAMALSLCERALELSPSERRAREIRDEILG